VLSEAGYNTAMWGKWHLGEEPEHLPEKKTGQDSLFCVFCAGLINWDEVARRFANAAESA
jgi:arylsulfatase A-like enzyme